MDNTKFFKFIIVILLLINISTLVFMWTSQMNHPRPMGRMDAGSFLTHELKLDANQQAQYEILKRQHHEKVEELRAKNAKFHDALYDLLHQPTTDSLLMKHALDDILETQKQIELITFYHFQDLRKICSPAQQKRFDEVIDEAVRMLSSRPPGPPNGPPPMHE